MTSVVGIVLGAGSSQRLGRPKQTLPLGDTTLLGWVVRNAEASSLDRVVVVLGGAAEEAGALLLPERAEVALSEDFREGCASSLQAGLDAAGSCDAVVLLLGDMPGVDTPVIDATREAWERGRPRYLAAEYEDGRGHPLAFGAEAFPALRALHGDKAVWKLLDAEPDAVAGVRIARPLPRDVDTWEDYEAVRHELAAPR
jgi:molybdenum cofactor cytidylyltransferase